MMFKTNLGDMQVFYNDKDILDTPSLFMLSSGDDNFIQCIDSKITLSNNDNLNSKLMVYNPRLQSFIFPFQAKIVKYSDEKKFYCIDLRYKSDEIYQKDYIITIEIDGYVKLNKFRDNSDYYIYCNDNNIEVSTINKSKFYSPTMYIESSPILWIDNTRIYYSANIDDWSEEQIQNLMSKQIYPQIFCKSNPKIIHLVLYSDSYIDMYNITKSYYKNFSDIVQTFYYKFDSSIEKIEIKNDMILIPGKSETLVPGVLDKTLKVIKYITNKIDDYDFIIRSNISTIVNVNLLKSYLHQNALNYAGGYICNIYCENSEYGIISEELHYIYNLNYFQGTAIIFSKECIKSLLIHEKYMNKNIIDDVVFGELARWFNYPLHPMDDKFVICSGRVTQEQVRQLIDERIFYRNKNLNPKIDIINMRLIIDELLH